MKPSWVRLASAAVATGHVANAYFASQQLTFNPQTVAIVGLACFFLQQVVNEFAISLPPKLPVALPPDTIVVTQAQPAEQAK